MFNFILAIPFAILKFLAAIVYISVVIAFYPFVVIGKLFTTSYYQYTKSYNTQDMNKKDLSDHIKKELESFDKGWVATLVKSDEYFDYYSYYNKSEHKEYGGLDRDLEGEDDELSLPLMIVRTVQFIGYTVSFPFVLSYCLVQGENSAPKTDKKFDGYQKSFTYCVYNYACDRRSGMYETIYFIKKKDENKEGAKKILCVEKDNKCFESQRLSSSLSLKNRQPVPCSNQENKQGNKDIPPPTLS